MVGGLVGGYIAAAHGWRWTQWVNVIIGAITFVAVFFLQPETMFDRDAAMAADSHPTNSSVADEKGGVIHEAGSETSAPTNFAPYTYVRSLGMSTYRGRWLHHFVSPWMTLRLPGVWVVMFQYGALVGGIVTLSTIAPQLVSAPPYLWGKNAGLVNVGGLIGAAIGAFFTYFFVDRILKQSAKKNTTGLSEPESRLPALVPGLFMATFGLLVFGLSAQNPAPKAWVGLQFGYGMLAFGLMQVPSVGFNYVSRNQHLCCSKRLFTNLFFSSK